MKWMVLILLVLPTVALAEVSDKMPSIIHITLQGIAIAAVIFILGWFRWWLGALLLPIFVLSVVGTIALWNEVGMREALLNEQGWSYFGALVFEDFIIGLATVVGAVLGYRRRSPNKAPQPTPKSGAAEL